jgi:2'-hydroxyisoflavone reductase
MRLLVLGGNVFLSRAVAEAAVARDHQVVCATRGRSGSVPAGARHIAHDRDHDAPAALLDPDRPFDAVVDVARKPSHVRSAVAALPKAHWTFISTISVYASFPRGASARTRPLLEPIFEDVEPSAETYGAMKAGCESSVRASAESWTIVRPGLIAGPGDPSGRFSYWPRRLAAASDGAPVLAPGAATDPVQLIDVRDLAAFVVRVTERRVPGMFDGTGPTLTWGGLMSEVAEAVAVDPTLVWATHEQLAEAHVRPWAGTDSLPLWLPMPEHAGMVGIDVTDSIAAGLANRPIATTAADTLTWMRHTADPPRTGITREIEVKLLTRFQG